MASCVTATRRRFRVFHIPPEGVLPHHGPWPTTHIAFYISTGAGNEDQFLQAYAGCSVPFFGFQDDGDETIMKSSTVMDHMDNHQSGRISGTGKRRLAWMDCLVSLIFDGVSFHNTRDEIFILDNAMEQCDQWNDIFHNNNAYSQLRGIASVAHETFHNEFSLFVEVYFNAYWQLQISAALGGPLWEKYTHLQQFILSHDFNDGGGNQGLCARAHVAVRARAHDSLPNPPLQHNPIYSPERRVGKGVDTGGVNVRSRAQTLVPSSDTKGGLMSPEVPTCALRWLRSAIILLQDSMPARRLRWCT